jgi:hypothetical protein
MTGASLKQRIIVSAIKSAIRIPHTRRTLFEVINFINGSVYIGGYGTNLKREVKNYAKKWQQLVKPPYYVY